MGHADQGIVDSRISMGMKISHDLANNLGALAIRLIGSKSHFIHAIKNTAMDRLQPVPDIWERSPNDDAHGVINIGALHFVFDVDWNLIK